MVASQIEEPVFQPDLFRVILLPEYRHRQLVRRPEHFDLVDVDFDLTGMQFRIFRAGWASAHLAVNTYNPYRSQGLGELERLAVGIGHDLSEPVVVAQIDKQDPTMIAYAMTPPR